MKSKLTHHSSQTPTAVPFGRRLAPLAILTMSAFATLSAQAQNTGNNSSISSATVDFGGQKNGQLIQGQTTLTNIDATTGRINTSATGNAIQGFDITNFASRANALGGMQVNSGTINSTSELLSSGVLTTKIPDLVNSNVGTANRAIFGSLDSTQRAGTFNMESQINSGSVTANTMVLQLDVNLNRNARVASLTNTGIGNTLSVVNSTASSGLNQINTGAINSKTELSTTGAGTLTSLSANTNATGNEAIHSNVNTVTLSNPSANVGVQNNEAVVSATTKVNATNVDGSTKTNLSASAFGNYKQNMDVTTLTHTGSGTRGLQNNAGTVSSLVEVTNFNVGGTGLTAVTSQAIGNNLYHGTSGANTLPVSFQQSGVANNGGSILQENKANVDARTRIVNTNFAGELDVKTIGVGNLATADWITPNAQSRYSIGSQVNSGQVSAITTWVVDPTNKVTVNSHATGNSINLSKGVAQ